jgi:hypothetical protein
MMNALDTILMPGAVLMICGRVLGARHQAVRVAHLDHHRAEVHGVGHDRRRLLARHALGAAHLVERLDVAFVPVRLDRVDDLDALQVGLLLGGHGPDRGLVADQHDVGQVAFGDQAGGLDRAGLGSLGQHDALVGLPGRRPERVHQLVDLHGRFPLLVHAITP